MTHLLGNSNTDINETNNPMGSQIDVEICSEVQEKEVAQGSKK